LKLDKSFFDFEHDLFVCAVYIPHVIAVHYDNDFALLENEVSIFANQGNILLIGDFNSRTGQSPHYILNDSTDLNNFSDNYILPRNYSVDQILKRINQDQNCNAQGKKPFTFVHSIRT
jgi:endonuclease/exonuclease/phosphatase family metal-dependent hydrolase